MQRAWVKHGAKSEHQGQQRAGHQPEGMKHRQRVEHDVFGCEAETRGRLLDIHQNIMVRKRHTLGQTFRAGGE